MGDDMMELWRDATLAECRDGHDLSQGGMASALAFVMAIGAAIWLLLLI